MPRTTYKPNHKGVAGFLNSGQLYRALERIAQDGKRYAESISPVDTGEYASSWQVSRSEVEINDRSRVAAKLENTAGYAAAVEWGYAGRKGEPNRPAHRVLGRTLEHMRGA